MNDQKKNNDEKRGEKNYRLKIPGDTAMDSAALNNEITFLNSQIELFDEIADHLSVIRESAEIMAVYFKRKGESESIFEPDDLSSIENNNTDEDNE